MAFPDGGPVCGARTKVCRSCERRYSANERDLLECPDCGEPRLCKTAVGREGDRCRMHGGKSPKGIASPAFRSGRYSRSISNRLAAQYDAARQDTELLSLRDDIALVEARVQELLAGLASGQGLTVVDGIEKSVGLIEAAQAKIAKAVRENNASLLGDGLANLNDAVPKMRAAMADVRREGDVWAEVMIALESKRRLIDGERHRLMDMQLSEELLIIIGLLGQSVRRNVNDPNAVRAIEQDIRRIAGEN